MTQVAGAARPKPMTGIAILCAFVALIALIYVAEWIPDLLPRSPNFALTSSDPAIRSPLFPITMSLLSALGITATVLLLKQHRYSLVSFTTFWILLVGCAAYSCVFIKQTYTPRELLSICV